ncbi:kinase-like domain-containing protein, partial [Tribonema minus]
MQHLKIDEKLGEGSFGVVYKGQYMLAPVAIKKIKKMSSRARETYIADLTALLSLRHRNIVSIVAHGYGILVMPLVSTSLTGYLETASKTRPVGRALEYGELKAITCNCCSALLYMHHHVKSCVTHNDIKPDNTLLELSPSGEVVKAMLGDVGLSRMCSANTGFTFIGTPGFM